MTRSKMDDDGYFKIARTLPRPTIEQTFRFAWFVAGAHSWYKHLPADRKVSFVFFLDPNAGKNLVLTPTGEKAMVEINDQSNHFHYTWQTTETYRRRFGHWNYFAPYGNSFFFASDGGTVTTERRPSILDMDGDWVPIPTTVLIDGTAQINAFVYPEPWLTFSRNEDAFREALNKLVLETHQHSEKKQRVVCDRLWDAIEDHLHETLRLCAYVRHFGEFDKEWEPHLRSMGATDEDVERAFAIFQRRMIEEMAFSMARQGDLAELALKSALERHRQLTDMWKAMRRFAAITYGDPIV
jgi:hypothetical protein